jgi:HK97 family phage portal protein
VKLRRRQREGGPDPVEAASDPARPNRIAPHIPLGPPGVPPALTAYADVLGLHPAGGGAYYSPTLVDKVGVANRCVQLAAQQIATMTLRYRRAVGLAPDAPEPQWVSNADPAWYPNGTADAVFAGIWSTYVHGETFLYVTSRYADGYPQTWSVLDAVTMKVGAEGGVRTYSSNGYPLDPDDVLHVMRDPRGALRGTGALQSYAANLAGAYAQERYAAGVLEGGGYTPVVLRPARRVTAEQAAELQAQWVGRAAERGGAPAVVPPDVAIEQYAWSPADLLLLESRQFDAAMICGAFGVPPPLVGLPMPTQGLTYQTVEQAFDTYLRTELHPAGKRLTNALSTWLPRGNWVEFDPGALLRPSLATAIDVAVKAIDAEMLTADEARAWVFDLPPLSQGEAISDIDEPAGVAMGAEPAALVAVPRDEVSA